MLAGQRAVVGGGRLIAVGRTPDVDIGQSAEVCGDFDRLVRGAVLAETDGVVSGDPDDLVMAQCGQTNSASGIGDEVLEGDVNKERRIG